MKKFIIAATVAVVAAVSFAAPSEAGNYGYGYGYKSYGYKSHGYSQKHYGYKKHRKHYSGYSGHYGGGYGFKVVIKKSYYGY